MRRRDELAVADDEDVLPRALADVADLVEEDRLVVAGVVRLGLGEDRVEVLARGLRVRDQALRRDAPPGRDLGADAVLLALVAEVGAPRPDRDRHLDRRVLGEEPHLAVAAEGERADVARVEAVPPDQLMRGLAKLVDRVLERQVVELRRRVQAIEMLAMAEHRRPLLGLVAADALEDPRAVVQPVAQDMDLGVVPSDELAVHPDPFRLFHGAPQALGQDFESMPEATSPVARPREAVACPSDLPRDLPRLAIRGGSRPPTPCAAGRSADAWPAQGASIYERHEPKDRRERDQDARVVPRRLEHHRRDTTKRVVSSKWSTAVMRARAAHRFGHGPASPCSLSSTIRSLSGLK